MTTLQDMNPSLGGGGSVTNAYSTPGTWQSPPLSQADQDNAFTTLKSLLGQYGLSSLTDWAWGELVNGRSTSQIALDMMDQPAFKQRFPAIDMRRAAGLPAISPGEYVSFEQQARQMMQAAGFPPGFYDHPDDFTKWIANDVSLSEVSQRVQLYQQAAYQAPVEVRQQLKNLYGIDEGGIAAFLADPERALPMLQQRFGAAQVAGEAQRQNFGQLTQSEAERLNSLGVTDAQAAQGFAQVANADQLFKALPGEQGVTTSRQTALGVVAGDAGAQQAADEMARRRKAALQGGGGFDTGKTGITGLGSAAT